MSTEFHPALRAFAAPRGLKHPHMQSILSGMGPRGRWLRYRAGDFVKRSDRVIVECGGGVRLLGLRTQVPRESRGLVIVLHGWEGCADSNYMLSAGARLFASGFDVLRLNFRDHGGTHHLNEELFHSCRIDEVVGAVAAVQGMHPSGPLFLAGFSLGGNFALRVAVRASMAGITLRRVIAICPVLRPHSTMRALEEGLWVYRRYFLRRWRRSLVAKACEFPERYNFGDLRRFTTLTDTTEHFVRNYTEFPDLDSYLEGYAITGSALQGLAVNSRMIMTRDDPVIPIKDLDDVAETPALSVAVLDYGGHCAMLESFGLRSWIDEELVRQCHAAL
jgi:predicted alpha/beta-fold hydrolase